MTSFWGFWLWNLIHAKFCLGWLELEVEKLLVFSVSPNICFKNIQKARWQWQWPCKPSTLACPREMCFCAGPLHGRLSSCHCLRIEINLETKPSTYVGRKLLLVGKSLRISWMESMENEEMDDTGLCWHCWHNDECNGRPAEIQAKGTSDVVCWVL